MSNYYVTKDDNGWKVKRENANRKSGTFNTQKQAETVAKKYCHNSGGGEVRIQGRNGKFRDSDTIAPGHDPYPPKDKNR